MAKRGGGGGHCERERSNPGFAFIDTMDCFVAALLAMTPRFVCSLGRPLHHAAHGPPPPRRCARGGGRNGGRRAAGTRSAVCVRAHPPPCSATERGRGTTRSVGEGATGGLWPPYFNEADAKRRLWRSAGYGEAPAMAKRRLWRSVGYGEAWWRGRSLRARAKQSRICVHRHDGLLRRRAPRNDIAICLLAEMPPPPCCAWSPSPPPLRSWGRTERRRRAARTRSAVCVRAHPPPRSATERGRGTTRSVGEGATGGLWPPYFNEADAKRRLWRSAGYGEAPAMAKRRLWRSVGYGEAWWRGRSLRARAKQSRICVHRHDGLLRRRAPRNDIAICLLAEMPPPPCCAWS